jgi:predicted protein tyrosine phosphatase
MVEVHPRLFIGTEIDFETQVASSPGWWVVHACKDPYHRRLLGYGGRGAPKDHPEYLIARRGRQLYLNLVDTNDPNYIPKEIVDAAIAFVDEATKSEDRVLIHCNLGESRAPSLGLLYLAARVGSVARGGLEAAEAEFRLLYPRYNPKDGMRGFLLRHWGAYVREPA